MSLTRPAKPDIVICSSKRLRKSKEGYYALSARVSGGPGNGVFADSGRTDSFLAVIGFATGDQARGQKGCPGLHQSILWERDVRGILCVMSRGRRQGKRPGGASIEDNTDRPDTYRCKEWRHFS